MTPLGRRLRLLPVACAAFVLLAIAPSADATLPSRVVYNANPPEWYQTAWFPEDANAFGRGSAGWFPNGDHLRSCDLYSDHRFVRAEVSWPGGGPTGKPWNRRVLVHPDPLESNLPTGCIDLNLDIPEGLTVHLRTCVEGRGCSAYYLKAHS